MKKAAVSGIIRYISLYTLLATIAFSGAPAAAHGDGDKRHSTKERISRPSKAALIAGQLESAYVFNSHFSPFDIDTDVEEGVVTLDGSVDSEIKKELAGRIAEGVDGVRNVDNRLAVDTAEKSADKQSETADGFGQWVSDASVSAVVKTKLAANEHIHSLDIGVETRDGVVTLSGAADSSEVRELIETIAQDTDGVRDVENNIAVNEPG
jgi:osmotically-inducible protein OsmY